MKVFNYSGGATKISGLFAKGEQIIREFGYSPDIITGVSSGALLALPTAMGLWDETRNTVLNFTQEHVFSIPPFNSKGKIGLKNMYRVVVGEPSLGKQGNLYDTLKSIITPYVFSKFCSSSGDTYPDVYIGVTNFNTGKFELINLKELSYDNFLRYTIASTSIPYAVEPVKIGDYYYYDGGVIHHTCSKAVLELCGRDVRKVITAFSRPEQYDVSYANFNGIDISQVFTATTDLQVNQVSLRDQDYEKLYCESRGIFLKQLFCPKVMRSLYDMDSGRIHELYTLSKNEKLTDFVDFID